MPERHNNSMRNNSECNDNSSDSLETLETLEAQLDALFDQAIDVWDSVDIGDDASPQNTELSRLMDLIEKYDRQLYPEYWTLRDNDEADNDEADTPSLTSDEPVAVFEFWPAQPIESIQQYIVEFGQQHENQDTLTLKLEGLIPVVTGHKLVEDCTDWQLANQGYIGRYAFIVGGASKEYCIRCPELV